MKKVIYLYKSGTLSRQDNSLVLRDKKDNVSYLPIEQIDTIICFGEITLNKRTLSLLNSYEVTILFYNYYGNYIGRFTPKKFYDGKILINQIFAYEDEEKRNYIAYTMLKASFHNCLSVLKYYHKKGFELDEHIAELEDYDINLKIDKVSSMLLIEAKFKKIYYSAFDIILMNEEFSFVRRSTRPPENEINALMSYGYALLYGNYLSIIDRSKLYSQISFIHSLTKVSESLQYDLADIIKPVIVDRLILSLCRHKRIKKEYFTKAEGKCYLNQHGTKFFAFEYEKYLQNSILINNKYYSYRNLISREVHLLSNYLMNEEKGYKPYRMKW